MADLFLPHPKFDDSGNVEYCGLYIEVKAGKDRLSTEQKGFQDHCSKSKYKFVVVRSAQEGIDTLLEYLGG